ncbi:hypothetical protein DEI89_00600 [Curtobacterium sp. MCBD17_030]|nr:hypothetical protein DEI89_00600 [Curtobacterium sp. MCBD17_030]
MQWTSPEDGFWLARVDGVLAGQVDRHRHGYLVTDAHSRWVGDYRDLGTAQQQLRRSLDGI